jgi:hypothetical protein
MVQTLKPQAASRRSQGQRSKTSWLEIIKFNKIALVGMPYGPHRITRVRQVSIPAELLGVVGLDVGDQVHFRHSDHDPHIIEILPSDVVLRRYMTGAEAEALERLAEPETLDDLLPPRREQERAD